MRMIADRSTLTLRSLAWLQLLVLAGGLVSPMVVGAETAGRIAYLALTEGTWQVWVASPDGDEASLVTRSAGDKIHCSWDPDGRTLLVSRLDSVPIRVDVATGRETPLSIPFSNVVDAVVSPDGSRIAFSAIPADTVDSNEIWLAKADGTAVRRITDMPFLQHQPAWSPDGRWLYFLSSKGGKEDPAHDVWRVAIDGTSREQITAGALYQFEVAVSPTGALAYSSNRSGNYEIWVERENAAPVPVTEHPALDSEPAWSPDGRSLLFTSTRGGVPNLWRVVPGEGGEGAPIQITHTRGGARAAAWWRSPREDGR